MKIGMLNTIINDLPDKSKISDGIFTLGELHKDRLSLYINLLDLLVVLYEAKGVNNILWISARDSNSEVTDNYMHLGLFHKDKKLVMGAKVPMKLWSTYESKSTILMEAPEYRTLAETLPNYFYERLDSPEII